MKIKVITSRNAILLIVLAIVLGTGCTKKPEKVGLDLVDDSKPVIGQDTTFEISAFSIKEDSVSSDEISRTLLGSRYSETFGVSNISFATHLRLGETSPDFGPNPTVDSVIFSMVYSNYYGDINTMQTVKIYELTQDIYRDSSYYSNIDLKYDTVNPPLAEYSFQPNPFDSVFVASDSNWIVAELRIPLTNEFGEWVLSRDSTYFTSSSDFIDKFKGIYVKADDVGFAGGGAILGFDLLDERSKVTVYYTNDTNTVDTLSYQFLINLNNAIVGKYDHSYQSSTDNFFIDQIVNEDTASGTEKLFIEGLGGVLTKFYFPEVAAWADSGNITINEAKLILTSTGFTLDKNEPPSKLLAFEYTETPGEYDFVDDYINGEDFLGGSFNTENNTYTFRITLYLQSLINGEPDYGLGIFPNAKSLRANELTLFGTGGNNPNRAKLEVIYTRMN